MNRRHPTIAAASAALIAATLAVGGLALPAHADESPDIAESNGSIAVLDAAPAEVDSDAAAATQPPETEPAEGQTAASSTLDQTDAAVAEAVTAEAAHPESASSVEPATPESHPATDGAAAPASEQAPSVSTDAARLGYVNDDGSEPDDDSPTYLPPRTGVSLDITADGAAIGVGPIGERGPIDSYELIVTPADGGEPITRTSTIQTVFVLTGLKPGAYEIKASLRNTQGSTGVSDMWFAVPETPGQPTVTIAEGGANAVIGQIAAAPLQHPYPASINPFRAQTTYTVTLTGAGATEVRTVDDVKGLARFGFTGLAPATTYTVTITAQNIAGHSAPVSVTATTDPDPGPAAPDPTELNADNRGGIAVSAPVKPGSTVTVAIGSDRAGTTINGWVFSEPRYLGSTVVSADGLAQFALPTDVAAGAHRLAITSTDGALLGWSPIEVRTADDSAPPAGGGSAGPGSEPGVGSGSGDAGASVGDGDGDAGVASAAGSVTSTPQKHALAATGGSAPWEIMLWAGALLAAGTVLMTRRRSTR